jgi:hypothetical protein
MIHTEQDDMIWADALDDFKPDYTPIPCWSVLQLFELRGRTTTLIKDNLIYFLYTYYCVYDANVKRYYKRLGRAYTIDELYFYKGEDEAISNIRHFVEDKTLTILMSQKRVDSVSETLRRLYKAYFSTDGKLDYRLYIKLLDLSLKLEDFKDNQKGVQGYKTAINSMEGQVAKLWQKAIPKI